VCVSASRVNFLSQIQIKKIKTNAVVVYAIHNKKNEETYIHSFIRTYTRAMTKTESTQQWEKYKHLQDVDVETSEKILQRLMQIHYKKIGNRHTGIWDLALELLERVLKHRKQENMENYAVKMLDVGVRIISKMMIEKKTVSFRDIVEYEYAILDTLKW
jgi:ribosomal protein S17E